MFSFGRKHIMLRDPETIRQLTIKDFDYFPDHDFLVNEKTDQLFANSLIMMHGDKWRDMRATLSPAFTGSKMRKMFELIRDCASDLCQTFLKQAAAGEKLDWEMKDLFSRYSNDVIATCAYGIKVNSLEDRENDFLVTGKKLMSFQDGLGFRFLFLALFPRIAEFFKMSVIDKAVGGFFRSMVLDTMQERESTTSTVQT